MKYDYEKDFAMSRATEFRFAEWLKSYGCQDVEVMPDDKAFHDYDIRTRFETYEIKHDRWIGMTNNLCIETHHNGSEGWFYKTKAKWLVVFSSETEFVAFNMRYIQDHYINNPKLWKRRIITQDSGAKTVCFLCDINALLHQRGRLK